MTDSYFDWKPVARWTYDHEPFVWHRQKGLMSRGIRSKHRCSLPGGFAMYIQRKLIAVGWRYMVGEQAFDSLWDARMYVEEKMRNLAALAAQDDEHLPGQEGRRIG